MIVQRHLKGDAESDARYSPCKQYRYELTRVWDASGPRALFVMLNPSTATEIRNDPTVERCERRARALGFGAFRVCNVFALRSTDPRELRRHAEPVGPDNDAAIIGGCGWANRRAGGCVVCAWGNHGAYMNRGPEAEALMRDANVALSHLGLTRAGHPRHPLYVPYSRSLETWERDA